jgi:hypothetical protein
MALSVLPTRLMVGLHLIKHARGLSDEQVCAQWLENAYFQYFSGETYFQTALPLDQTSMSVWRARIGPEKLEALIAETLAAARRAGAVEPSQMRRLTIDTTAQTKAVAHPTDSLPLALRDLVDEPLSPWRPAAQAGHIGLRPGFIDEDQPPGVDEPLIASPSFAVATYVRAILLARDEGLFLSVTPIRRKKRLIIEVSALTPRSAERRSQRA